MAWARRILRLRWAGLAIMCGWIFAGDASQAVAQFVAPPALAKSKVTLPIRTGAGGGPGSGFTAMISVSRKFSVGYVEVTIRLNSNRGPLAATRNLSVRLSPTERHLPSDQTMAVEFPITFDQGTRTFSATRLFPKWTIGNTFRVEIAEDGVALPDYAVEIGDSFPAYASQAPDSVMPSEIRHDVAFVQCEPKLLRTPQEAPFYSQNDAASWFEVEFEELPTDWRLLRDVDTVVIPRETLLSQLDTERFETLRVWTLVGGTLVLIGEGDDTEELSDELTLTLSSSDTATEYLQSQIAMHLRGAADRIGHYEAWLESSKEFRALQAGNDNVAIVQNTPRSLSMDRYSPPTEKEITTTRSWIDDLKQETATFQESWKDVVPRSAGSGKVVELMPGAMDSALAFLSLRDLNGFRNSSMLERGVDPILGDMRTRRWLIPGVAQPPVYTFIGALSLFVILVGPIAYRWTTRGGRSHLMFLIAPVLALLTTVSMFAYSIVADGFGTTMRVRQVTWIDGASGDAVERTRSTLFAGISPASGLRFPVGDEVMIYPDGAFNSWLQMPRDPRETRLSVRIDEESQTFSRQLLPSRTQSQFISHRFVPEMGRVTLAEIPEFDTGAETLDTSPAKLISTLPFTLRELVARSSDGRYWRADRLGSGESSEAIWVRDSRDASKRLSELYTRHRLVGAASEASGQRLDSSDIGDLMMFVNREVNPQNAEVTDGTFETWINRNLFIRSDLPPGCFVAVAEPSAESAVAEDAEIVDSVRYVLGTLK